MCGRTMTACTRMHISYRVWINNRVLSISGYFGRKDRKIRANRGLIRRFVSTLLTIKISLSQPMTAWFRQQTVAGAAHSLAHSTSFKIIDNTKTNRRIDLRFTFCSSALYELA